MRCSVEAGVRDAAANTHTKRLERWTGPSSRETCGAVAYPFRAIVATRLDRSVSTVRTTFLALHHSTVCRREVFVPYWYAPMTAALRLLGPWLGELAINHAYVFNSAEYVERIAAAKTALNL